MKTVRASIVPEIIAGLALMVTTATAVVLPPLVNPGFESGSFAGWTLALTNGGAANVVSSHLGDLGTLYAPVEGNYFAKITTGGAFKNEIVFQSVSMLVGDALQGYAAFDYGDAHPYNDFAFVRIFNSAGTQIAQPWVVNGGSVPDHYDGPWTAWSWTATVAGTYTLKLGAANDLDAYNNSYGLFDAVQLVPVPEPGTGTLMVGALLLLVRKLRKA